MMTLERLAYRAKIAIAACTAKRMLHASMLHSLTLHALMFNPQQVLTPVYWRTGFSAGYAKTTLPCDV